MKFKILLKQDFRNIISMPVIINFSLIYPMLFIIVLGFVFKNMYTTDIVSSYDFYGVSIMIFVILTSVTITPNVIMEETVKEGNIRISYAPVSRFSVCMSKIISSFVFLAVSFTLDMVILKSFNIVNYGKGREFFSVWGIFMMFLLAAITFGAAACTIIKSENMTNKILSLITEVLGILSGLFFPIDRLGKSAERLADLSPIKKVTDNVFEIIYDGKLNGYGSTMIILAIIVVISITVALYNYRVEDFA